MSQTVTVIFLFVFVFIIEWKPKLRFLWGAVDLNIQYIEENLKWRKFANKISDFGSLTTECYMRDVCS